MVRRKGLVPLGMGMGFDFLQDGRVQSPSECVCEHRLYM